MTKYKKPLSPQQITKLDDADIDFSDIAELDADFWKNAKIVVPEKPKEQLTLRLDADVVEWFKAQGKGYQTRINAVLRSFYEAQ